MTHAGTANPMEPHVFKSDRAATAVLDRYRDYLRRWPVDSDQRHIPTRQGPTFVVSSGPKGAPPVVLLHGTMGNAAMWLREVAAWSTASRVHAVDVIGEAGLSASSRPPLASDAHALWLCDVLDGLGVQQATVVGTSLGGGLALDLAIRAPDRVDGLVLLTPARVADKNIIGWALPLLLLGPWGARKVRERIVGHVATAETEDAKRFAVFMDAIFDGMKPRTEGAPAVTDEQLARLNVPVLVLLGADDVTMDAARIEQRFERLVRGAEVVVFPNTRHYLGDQSDRVAAFLHTVHEGVEHAGAGSPQR